MPGGDGTGPMGMGPMTGRAAGYCGGYGMPGYMNPVGGRGFGFGGRGGGRGAGRGFRHWFYATGWPGRMRGGPYPMPYQQASPELRRQALESQAQALQSELDLIKKDIAELETGAAPE